MHPQTTPKTAMLGGTEDARITPRPGIAANARLPTNASQAARQRHTACTGQQPPQDFRGGGSPNREVSGGMSGMMGMVGMVLATHEPSQLHASYISL
jgi:hypothetical protein